MRETQLLQSMTECADEIEACGAGNEAAVVRKAKAEILKLTKQLEEAREKAIAECRTAVQGLAYLSDFPHPHETLTRADKALKALLNGTAK